MDNCSLSWKSLFDCQRALFKEWTPKAATYNGITFSEYKASWKHCEQLMKKTKSFPLLYSIKELKELLQPMQEVQNKYFQRIEQDLKHILCVSFSLVGSQRFRVLYNKMESFLISLLGHISPEVRFFAIVQLNSLYEHEERLICRYDGHDWQLSSPFPVHIQEVGEDMVIEISKSAIGDSHYSFYYTLPWENSISDTDLSSRIIMHCSIEKHPTKS